MRRCEKMDCLIEVSVLSLIEKTLLLFIIDWDVLSSYHSLMAWQMRTAEFGKIPLLSSSFASYLTRVIAILCSLYISLLYTTQLTGCSITKPH